MARASTLEQNHLEPFRYQRPLSCLATVSLLDRSEPPRISVMNMAPSQEPSNAADCSFGRTRSRTSGGA